MNFEKLAVKLLEDGHLTLADLVLDLKLAGVKYNELFGFNPEILVLKKLQQELKEAQ